MPQAEWQPLPLQTQEDLANSLYLDSVIVFTFERHPLYGYTQYRAVVLSLSQGIDECQAFIYCLVRQADSNHTHYLLGRLYNQQKRTEEAEHEFKKFRELDKNPANREFPITDR